MAANAKGFDLAGEPAHASSGTLTVAASARA